MPFKVLMVCLGNICRSPLAEGILTDKVDPEKIIVDSAGTAGYHVGNSPDPRSIAVAHKYGINIKEQRCRKFTREDFKAFDRIYAMDRSNYSNIVQLAKTPEEKNKVSLLMAVRKAGELEVPDPYYDADDGFETVYHMINEACTLIAKELQVNYIQNMKKTSKFLKQNKKKKFQYTYEL